jgi:cytochrome d ubiquinol oxidase subunit II
MLNPYSLLGGLATLTLFTLDGALFLAVKTLGDLRRQALVTARLSGLTARWEAGGPDVLHGADLWLPAGQRVAVTGPSGSGKTTLAWCCCGSSTR